LHIIALLSFRASLFSYSGIIIKIIQKHTQQSYLYGISEYLELTTVAFKKCLRYFLAVGSNALVSESVYKMSITLYDAVVPAIHASHKSPT
jgi:hypothetical protein